MLITPEFVLSQTDSHVRIMIRAPFAKIQETEIWAHGCEFYFFSSPYHLHLNLPGLVCDTEEQVQDNNNKSRVKYDVDRQTFDVELEKCVQGQYFEGLGLITSMMMMSMASPPLTANKNNAQRDVLLPLLRPEVDSHCNNSNNNAGAPRLPASSGNFIGEPRRQLIEEIESCSVIESATNKTLVTNLDEGSCKIAVAIIPPHFNWTLDHEDHNDSVLAQGDNSSEISVKLRAELAYSYGFGNRFRNDDDGRFAKIQECFPDVVDFRCPIADFSLSNRLVQKNAKEGDDFSEDHYLANIFDPEDVNAIKTLVQAKLPSFSSSELSEEDRRDMIEKLKNRSYLLSFDESVCQFLGLVDILFAYAYDMRVTSGEHCAESAWNISKISSVLSWFVQFKSLHSVCRSCFRRSLTYPLYRNFQLSSRCWRDVAEILRHGRETALKALLDIRRIFSTFDSSLSPKYILNDLYILDYCVWIQKVAKDDLNSLAQAVDELRFYKSDVELDIELIEDSGFMALCENDDQEDQCDTETMKRRLEKGRQPQPSSSISRHVGCEIENSFEKLCLDG